jgi:hypothetical protein
MEGTTTLAEARDIMGANFIGPNELSSFTDKTCFANEQQVDVPAINFAKEALIERSKDYILILGVPKCKDGTELTLNKMRFFFGINPDLAEPCFYNQDWYLNEAFVNSCTIEAKWYLVKKALFNESRGQNPDSILKASAGFPSALLTAYTFFCWFFHSSGELLWQHDYIWCQDVDHNLDRVYTGRYIDIEGTNKTVSAYIDI